MRSLSWDHALTHAQERSMSLRGDHADEKDMAGAAQVVQDT
jgi:hypothetical protein